MSLSISLCSMIQAIQCNSLIVGRQNVPIGPFRLDCIPSSWISFGVTLSLIVLKKNDMVSEWGLGERYPYLCTEYLNCTPRIRNSQWLICFIYIWVTSFLPCYLIGQVTTLVHLTFWGNILLHRENLANLSRQVGSTCSECYLSLDDIGLRSSDFSRKFKNYKILFTWWLVY